MADKENDPQFCDFLESNFLDEQNKKQIIKNIHDHFKNKIVIMVSHDMDILNYSDKIYELKNNKLNLFNKLN